GIKFEIQREKFLNYRLLRALIKQNKQAIKTHILFYSHFKNSYTKFSILDEGLKHYKSAKDEINLWSFDYFNSLCKMRFKNYEDFLQNPLKIEQEIKIRQKHFGAYDLSPVIIVENIAKGAYEFMAKSEIYFDSKEKIVKL
ncbi:diacylglucosamine hydrolase like protein, partial [Campylobacter lari]|nr:diacylglucosamine hydrolase like protein [Campylobacter lari]